MYERFVLSLSVLAGVSSVFAWLSWRKRTDPGGVPMVVFHLALALGAATYALDISTTGLSRQILWQQTASVAQGVVAVAWLYAALQYADFDRRATRALVGVLALEPLLLSLGFLAPWVSVVEWPASGTSGSLLRASGTMLTPIYVAHMATILVAALAGSLVLVQLFVRSRHLYRTQSAAVLVAALSPWTIALTQQYFLDVPEDASIFAWGVSGVALTIGLYSFKTLDPVPAARDTIVEHMGDGTVVLDSDECISDVNPVARRLLGDGGGPLVGRQMGSVLDGWDEVVDTTRGSDEWHELSLTVDGERRFLDAETTPFTDRFGDEVGTLVVLRDVTERERREQRLTQYKTIFDAVTEPVYVLDDEDRFLRYNEPFGDLVGYEDLELVGEPVDTVLGTGPVATDGGAVTLSETTVTTASGAEVPCEADIAAVELADGSRGWVGIIRDISRRKAIESELAATSERLETIVQASPLAILTHDADGVVEVWNPAAESLFGWTAAEARGEQLPIVPEEHRAELVDRHRRVQSGEHLTGWETELRRKDGSTISASVSAAPIRDRNGIVTGTVAIIADISEQKTRQRRLERQNERLDEFASLVSHDLRNPLQVATGNLELARESPPGEAADLLENADEALRRMGAIIDDTLKLARQGRDIGETESATLDALAERAWGSVETRAGTLTVTDPPTVECDPDRVVELLENLFNNAVTHGADGDGAVTVTVGDLDDGFYVEDDGVGIPAEERGAVFESGYTTSADGTGFGLAIVETVADAHGWDAAVTTGSTGGARFEFTGVDLV